MWVKIENMGYQLKKYANVGIIDHVSLSRRQKLMKNLPPSTF